MARKPRVPKPESQIPPKFEDLPVLPVPPVNFSECLEVSDGVMQYGYLNLGIWTTTGQRPKLVFYDGDNRVHFSCLLTNKGVRSLREVLKNQP